MEEIEIKIEVIKDEMQSLTIKADNYSAYGRSPSDDDYLKIIELLQKWVEKRQQLIALEDVLKSIVNNKK